MSVDGRELASLDFPNLIGGPLNAIVEAQAKSAITTANFIKEVAFDKDGKAIHVDFRYDRTGSDGRHQEFTLSVPFLTMLPVPYLTVETGEIEFNAKITSTRENSTASSFQRELSADISGNAWYIRAGIKAKASQQKSSKSSDNEQRAFDMRVLVQVRNTDIPPGTERLLQILENSIQERGGAVKGITGAIEGVSGATLRVSSTRGLESGWTVNVNGAELGAITVDHDAQTITVTSEVPATVAAGDTFSARPA